MATMARKIIKKMSKTLAKRGQWRSTDFMFNAQLNYFILYSTKYERTDFQLDIVVIIINVIGVIIIVIAIIIIIIVIIISNVANIIANIIILLPVVFVDDVDFFNYNIGDNVVMLMHNGSKPY